MAATGIQTRIGPSLRLPHRKYGTAVSVNDVPGRSRLIPVAYSESPAWATSPPR